MYLPYTATESESQSILKQSLNSEFFYSETGYIPRLRCQFIDNWRENSYIYTFPEGISIIWNEIIPVQFWTRVAVSIFSDETA